MVSIMYTSIEDLLIYVSWCYFSYGLSGVRTSVPFLLPCLKLTFRTILFSPAKLMLAKNPLLAEPFPICLL